MAIPTTPFTQRGSDLPYVPSGYESLSADIQRKRAIAESLLNAQHSGPMKSYLEPLAQMFEAWSGKHLEKKADEQQADLDWQRQQAQQAVTQQISEALAGGAKPGDIASKFGSDPRTANLPVVKAMTDAWTKQMANSGEVDGAPIQLKKPDGTIGSFMRMKDGSLKAIDQGTVANEMKLGPSGQVYDPMAIKPGTALGDVSKEVFLGPDGKPMVNQPLIGAKESIARAGKTVVNTNTYVNAMDKSFGKVIPEATIADLTKSRDAALSYIQTKPELDRAAQVLKKGIIGGFAADARMNVARAADFFGVTGKSNSDRIANTQTYVRNMGRQMLPILQALRPASDTDVKTAAMMAGGDLSLSPKAMMNAIEGAREAGANAVRGHKARVQTLQQSFGSNPEIAAGLGTFDVPDAGLNTGDRVAQELARRRGAHK